MHNMLFSIIISKRPNDDEDIIDSLKKIKYPQEKIEVLFVEGYHPSVQRNRGAQDAKGDVLCFFDNDCRPSPDYFNEVTKGFYWNNSQEVAVVGGPSLAVTDDSLRKKLFSYALSSYFAHSRMRARYKSIGKLRESNEKELIGCNLCIKRSIFEKLNGFNEAFYPNEENEFLNRVKKIQGCKIIYNPNVIVYREMKDSLFDFAKRFFRYGRGRAKQILSESLQLNFVYLLPVGFLLYLVGLIFIRHTYYPVVLWLYIATAYGSSFLIAWKEKRIILFLLLPVIYLVMHLSYALGIVFGLIKKLISSGEKEKEIDLLNVTVKRRKGFNELWESCCKIE